MKRIFIDGLSGMAQGLFATLIIGTIIQQMGMFVGGNYGDLIYLIGKVAAALTGAGIGVGVARKLEAQQLVTVCAAVAGMIGAFAGENSGRSGTCRWEYCISRDRGNHWSFRGSLCGN